MLRIWTIFTQRLIENYLLVNLHSTEETKLTLISLFRAICDQNLQCNSFVTFSIFVDMETNIHRVTILLKPIWLFVFRVSTIQFSMRTSYYSENYGSYLILLHSPNRFLWQFRILNNCLFRGFYCISLYFNRYTF